MLSKRVSGILAIAAALGAQGCGNDFSAAPVGAGGEAGTAGEAGAGSDAGTGGGSGSSGAGTGGASGSSGSSGAGSSGGGAGGSEVNPCDGADDGDACGDAKVCVDEACEASTCGDKVVDARTETCDDGNENDDDGCTNLCQLGCETSEDCSDLDACNGQETCTDQHVCEVGQTPLENGEACGDGEIGDRICIEQVCTESTCGDKLIDARTETCDDGQTGGDSDGCTDLCQLTCVKDEDCVDANECNGVETCDLEANQCVNGTALANGTTCSSDSGYICLSASCVESKCGDLYTDSVTSTEQCDDGQGDETDGCKNDCTFTCVEDGDCPQDAGCETCDAEHTCHPVTLVPAPADLKQCSLFEDYGVFVRPDDEGSDDNDGSRESPFKTLAKAVASATATNGTFVGIPRIYVCADVGAYDETLSLAGVSTAVELYGNVNCDGAWGYSPGARAVVAPQTAGAYALHVKDSTATVRIEGFHFKARDAEVAGGSSIAAFAANNADVSMVRVDITAGTGKAGTNGAQRASNHASGDLKGNAGSGALGGATKLCVCGDATKTYGGRGGSLDLGTDPEAGKPGSDTNNNAGANGAACTAGKSGTDGTLGTSGTNATTSGVLTAGGWTPASGTRSENGTPGQGGGGGGALATVNLGGGGGGCGGCGGAGAEPGMGGGASIALLSFSGGVTLDATCTLTAKSAGKGGDGAQGQGKQTPGGTGGDGAGTAVKACSGGRGGDGGDGGHSGAGAGGVSAGVAFVGTAPPGADQAAIEVASTAAAAGVDVGVGGVSPAAGITLTIWPVPVP